LPCNQTKTTIPIITIGITAHGHHGKVPFKVVDVDKVDVVVLLPAFEAEIKSKE
jgi:hypothetical protein